MNVALAILLLSLAVTSTLAKPRPNCVFFCNDNPLGGGGSGFGQVQQPIMQKPNFQLPSYVQQPAQYQQQPSYTGGYGQPSYGGNYVQQPGYTGSYANRPSGYRPSANVETLEPVATVGGGFDQAVMFHHAESSSHNSQTGYVSYPVRRPTEQIRVQRPCANDYVDPCTV